MEDLKNLIDKINEEGINAAQKKAREIESQAQESAQFILEKARLEAKHILSKAKEDSAKAEEATRALLKQASRDLMLNLRKEIDVMLEKIISSHIQQALTPQELLKIINALVKDHCSKEAKASVVISVGKHDFEKLEKSFLSELKEEIKRGIIIKSSDDISFGFTISYDADKSHFDFTDKALVEYISSELKPKLAEILK